MSRKTYKNSLGILMMGLSAISVLLFSEWLSAAKDPIKTMEIMKYKEKKKASDFTLKNLDGEEVSLSSFAGKVVLLNFWATWCIPCRTEMPSMEKLYQEFKDQGLVVLALDYQEGPDKVKPFVEEMQLSFPILLDPEGKVSKDYAVRALPITYLIDRQGFLVGSALGDRDWASKDAKQLIKSLLKSGLEKGEDYDL